MQTGRREFIKFGGLFAAAGVAGCRSLFTASAKDYDDSLTVFISDLHVGGTERSDKYQESALRRAVAEILRMDPLPRRVVCFGDIAWLTGLRPDYQRSKPILQQLVDAGIDLKMTMGNHDRRSTFLELWPEYAKSSPVPGRIVSVIPLQHADLVLLDALKGSDDRGERDMGPVDGTIDPAQLEWFESWVAQAKRPFFIGTHQCSDLRLEGKSLAQRTLKSPFAAGWIHGHDHRWAQDFRIESWRSTRTLPILTLPSTGHWGDIGYVRFRTSPGQALAELVQYDFYFPKPVEASKRPASWDLWVADNRDKKMHFVFPA